MLLIVPGRRYINRYTRDVVRVVRLNDELEGKERSVFFTFERQGPNVASTSLASFERDYLPLLLSS